MSRTLLVNKGVADRGKSASIKMLVQEILSVYKQASYQAYHYNYNQEQFFNADLSYKGDVTVIINIDGTKIGIESQGDPKSIIFKSLPFFVDQNCDIIVCASRTYGATYDIVEEISSEHNYDLIWLTNPRAKHSNAFFNLLFVKQVISIIENLPIKK